MIDEVKPIEGSDVKCDSEGFQNRNYGQENYDGMTIFVFYSNDRYVKIIYLFIHLQFVFFSSLEYALLNSSAS